MNAIIYGYGVVGKGMHRMLPGASIHDPALGLETQAAEGDLAVICVPTEMRPNGSCDTSIVERVVRDTPCKRVLIKSTVPPGTTQFLALLTGKTIVFSPEFMGESRYHTPPQFPSPDKPETHGWIILGGPAEACSEIADLLLPVLGPTTRFRFMDSSEAEMVKYAVNTYFAMKVAFANEMRRICDGLGLNYHRVREGWLDDPRIGPMHSVAFADAPGFGGKCLPKDTAALVAHCARRHMELPLHQAVLDVNKAHRAAR